MLKNIKTILFVTLIWLSGAPSSLATDENIHLDTGPATSADETAAMLEAQDRNLGFLTKHGRVVIDSPANSFSTHASSMDVKVSYDAKKPLLSLLFGFRKVKVFLDGHVVARKSLGLLGKNKGTATITIDLTPHERGKHSLKAQAEKMFRKSPMSSEVIFTIVSATPTEAFVDETFVPGLYHEETSTVEDVDGVSWKVDANITFIEQGIVSLAGDTSMVDQVTCLETAKVRIQFLKEIPSLDIVNSMFPNGTILTVDGDVYGECILETFEEDKEPLATRDGYLVIENVVLSSDKKHVEISGSPTSFLFLFQDATFSMDPGSSESRSIASHNDRRLATFSGSKVFGATPLKVRVGADLTVAAYIGKVSVSIGLRKGVVITVPFGIGLSAGASLEFAAETGGGTVEDKTYPLFSYPLFGLDLARIPILSKFNLPRPRAGAFLDVDFFWNYVLQSAGTLTAGAKFEAGTGIKKFEFKVSGGWGGINVWVDRLPSGTAYSTAELTHSKSSELSAKLDAFAGISPNIAVEFFGLGRMWVKQRTGVQISAEAAFDGLVPTPSCSDCHDLSIDADIVMENLSCGIWVKFELDFPWWIPIPDISIGAEKRYKAPGDLLRKEIVSECFGQDNFGAACNNQCCDKGLQCVSSRGRRYCGCPAGTVYVLGACVAGPSATIVKPSGCNRRFLRSSSSSSVGNTQHQQRRLPNADGGGCNFQTGEDIVFSGTGNGSTFEWSSSIDGLLGTGKTLSRMLTVGTHTITLKVSLTPDSSSTDTVTVKVTPGPGVPTVSIVGPTTSHIYLSNGNEVILVANASDSEDGVLVGDSVVWRSDKQGLLGKGPVVRNVHFRDVPNCGGREWHTVTCTATDSDGNYVTDTITVAVTMPVC